MEPTESDLGSAARIRAGDKVAFEKIFRSHYEMLFSYAYGMVRTEAAASEIIVDVFATIWNSRSDWKPIVSVRGNIISEVRSRAIDYMRRDLKWNNQSDQGVDISRTEEDVPPVREVENILASISGIQREIGYLRWRAKLGQTEIALLLGTSEGSVNSHLNKIIGEVKSYLPDLSCNPSVTLIQLDRYLGGDLDYSASYSLKKCLDQSSKWSAAIEQLSSLEFDQSIGPVNSNVDADFARTQFRIRGIEAIEKSKREALIKAQSESVFTKAIRRFKRRRSYKDDARTSIFGKFSSQSLLVIVLLSVIIFALLIVWFWR